jgi:hypothetical protein
LEGSWKGAGTPLPCFLEVLIPGDSEFIFSEVLILEGLKREISEVLILGDFKGEYGFDKANGEK